MVFVELLEVIFSSILTLILPEKTAEKVRDVNTSKSTRRVLITLFTVIYSVIVIGMAISIVYITDILYRVFASVLIMFLLYCLFVFYNRAFKHK